MKPRLQPGVELSVLLLHRSYCYLRLSGLEPAPALSGLRSSLDALASAGDAAASEAVWARLQELTAHPVEPVASAPPLLRGHMVYP